MPLLASLGSHIPRRSITYSNLFRRRQPAMILRRQLTLRPCLNALRYTTPRTTFKQIRCASNAELDPDILDPNMNGGYINPPPMKRSLRDPYAPWWDKQERRNFNEPVHEDNDILGVFSTEPYTHSTPGKAFFHLSVFMAAVGVLCGVVYQLYPDRPSAPRTFGDGLERELGGNGALLARKDDELD